MADYRYLGKPRPLVEGAEKVTGHVRYTADLVLPRLIYARPILSPYAHARLLGFDLEEAAAAPGVVAVLTAADLPLSDRPATSRNSAVLARDRVLWRGQPVAVVVAESEAQAADAAERVRVHYEPLPAVTDLEAALAPEAPLVWPDGPPGEESDLTAVHTDEQAGGAERQASNVHTENRYERGNTAAGMAEADVVVERTYTTSMLHQAYLEPHACVADPDALGRGLTLYTSTQGPFLVRDEVARILALPAAAVRVVPMAFGGGFGAKYGILEPLAGAVALA